MQIINFKAQLINGYLNFDIPFFEDVTFITGINGSGKTTILNAIMAIISPNLQRLARLEYKNLILEIINNGKKYVISVDQDHTSVSISIKGIRGSFPFNRYLIEEGITEHYQSEDPEELHYRELIESNSQNLILRFLIDLPRPMFLGLDRRAQIGSDARQRAFARPRAQRAFKGLLGTSLAASLKLAVQLADAAYRDTLIKTGEIRENLQQHLLLNILSATSDGLNKNLIPTFEDRQEVTEMQNDIDDLARIFEIPRSRIGDSLGPLLEKLQSILSKIPENINNNDVLRNKTLDNSVLRSIFEWSTEKSTLQRIKIMREAVSEFNNQKIIIDLEMKNYLNTVNSFFLTVKSQSNLTKEVKYLSKLKEKENSDQSQPCHRAKHKFLLC
jgi:energy-coupling factor transporter ATP-binding protein EcfA2